MKFLYSRNITVFVLLIILLFLVWVVTDVNLKNTLQSKAASANLTMEVALGGIFDEKTIQSYKTTLVFYNQYGKALETSGHILKHKNGNIFETNLKIYNLDFAPLYAIYIKPDKYLGTLFCLTNQTTTSCNVPKIRLKAGNNYLDLKSITLTPGDVQQQDGIISAYDVAKVLNDYGKTTTSYLETDLNNDNVVNLSDYLAVVDSLSKNLMDEPIRIVFQKNPVSQKVTASPSPMITQTNTPPTTPTHTVNPIITNTLLPTPIPTQIPIQSGTCNLVLNGKLYINTPFGSQCESLNNEPSHICVQSAIDCNSNTCVNGLKAEVRDSIQRCGYGGMASLDDLKTQISCQTQFTPGACQPPPPSSCDATGGGSC